MRKTPNHQYNIPEEGATDWHVALNENFERIDDGVEIRDTEANKGDYEPKDGAKYEATDSGAVYLGNGSSWVLTDRQVKLVRAESVNNVRTPSGTDIESFRDAVDSGNYVRLKPDVTYEWDETFTFDPAENDSLTVDASGATIDHSSDPAVDILRSERKSNTSQIEWIGGTFDGPGAGAGSSVSPNSIPDKAPSVSDGSSAFRVTDSFGHTIEPEQVRGVRAAVYIRNKAYWSESLEIAGGCHPGTVDYFVLALGGNYLGTSGGSSMRNIKIDSGWGDSRGGHVTIYQGGVGFHGGEIIHRGNVSNDGWGWYSNGNLAGTTIYWESEFGNENSIDIEFAGDANGPPPFIARPASNNRGIVNSRQDTILYWDGGSFLKDAGGKKGVNVAFNTPEWVWQGDVTLTAGAFASKNPLESLSSTEGLKHSELTYYAGDDENPAGWYWYDDKGDVDAPDRWYPVNRTAPHDSGTTSLSSGETKTISTDSAYESGYYDHAVRGTVSGGGGVNVVFKNGGTDNPRFVAEETTGTSNINFDWIIYKVGGY